MLKDIDNKTNFSGRMSTDERELLKECIELHEELSGEEIKADRQFFMPLFETYLSKKKPLAVSKPEDLNKIKSLEAANTELLSRIEEIATANKNFALELQTQSATHKATQDKLQADKAELEVENAKLTLDLNSNYNLVDKLSAEKSGLQLKQNQYVIELNELQINTLLDNCTPYYIDLVKKYSENKLHLFIKRFGENRIQNALDSLWNFFALINIVGFERANKVNVELFAQEMLKLEKSK